MNVALESHYNALLGDATVEADADYARLVTPNSNDSEPVHQWFHMKEAFSANFLEQVVKDCGFDGNTDVLRLVDPFAGSGTVAVSAAGLNRNTEAYGVECNPFLHLLASTKQRSIQRPPTDLATRAEDVLREARLRIGSGERFRKPKLSTFHNTKYFNAAELRKLLAIAAVLDERAQVGESVTNDLLRVAAAGSVEPISKLRRDGRALRHWPKKSQAEAFDAFRRRVDLMTEDLASLPLSNATGEQFLGDARSLDVLPAEATGLNLAVFSPPYPNNIDYTEVYKLEAWLLQLIADSDQFRAQRLRSLHSHPSIRREATVAQARSVSTLVDPIAAEIEEGRYKAALVEMLTGYVAEMSSVFSALAARMAPGGRLVFAVGNSAHGPSDGGVIVASDVLLVAAARSAGFTLDRIAVARQLTRRRHESEFLRESVCFLTLTDSGVADE